MLAFTLWNAGYDVWLPNHRGTYYTRRHVSLKADSVKFWDFTFHEIGVYDYSAICRFVKKKTSSKNVIFIGHSMSTTSALIYASMKPEESKDLVKLYILLSPTSTFKYATTPIGYFAKMLVQVNFHFISIKIYFIIVICRYLGIKEWCCNRETRLYFGFRYDVP